MKEKMMASQYNIYLHKRKRRHDEHEGEDQGNNTEMYYRMQRRLNVATQRNSFCKRLLLPVGDG